MTRLSAAALLFAAACASGSPGPGPSNLGPELDVDTTMSVKLKAADFKCPAGTTMRPKHSAMICYDPDGKAHGPISFWHENGELAGLGEFDHGVRTGLWRAWSETGKPRELSEHRAGKSHGRYVLWHDNGKRSVEGVLVDGKRDGAWRTWHENGNQRDEQSFKAGVPDGRVARWHENGKASLEGTVVAGKKHGKWRVWADNGKQVGLENWDHGVPEGPVARWHDDGTPDMTGSLTQGKKNGKWQWWREGGKLAALGVWKRGVRDGRFIDYDDDGKPVRDRSWKAGKRTGVWKETEGRHSTTRTYVDDVAQGDWSVVDNGITVFQGRIADDKKTGPWIELIDFRDDAPPLLATGEYRDGLKHGVWTTKGGDRVLAVQGYAAGKPDGAWKFFESDGKPRDEGVFTAGERNGTFTHWEDGQKHYVINYKNGKPHGRWQFFDQGKPRVDGVFKDGQPDGTWTFRQDGKPRTERWKLGKRVGPEVRDGMSENFWENQLSKPESWSGAPQWPNLEEDEDGISKEDATWEDMSNGDWAEENEWGEHQPQFGPQSGDDLE